MLNKMLFGLFCLCLSGFLSAKQPGADILPNELFPVVELQTTTGKIKVELDRMRAPITVNNFLFYVKSGSYDGTIFHRVEKDFVIQGGGYDAAYKERDRVASIFNESGNGLKNEMFTIAMARDDDPHSAERQFYFNLADNEGLDPGKTWGYAVFGLVLEGEDVLLRIAETPVHTHPKLLWENVPTGFITLKKAIIISK